VKGGTASASSSAASLEAEIAYLEGILQKLLAEAGAQGAAVSVGPSTFTRNLALWDVGTDVTALQQFLVTADIGPAAQKLKVHGVTRVFGLLTLHALQEYQRSVGVPATGYFGPLTRAAILRAH